MKYMEGNKFIKIGIIRWFTNIKTDYRQPPLQLTGNYYSPKEYQKYDNYDAINVDKVADIPCDYPGIMGVPLTFIDKYCPDQFEIVGLARNPEFFVNGKLKKIYNRILVKNKHPEESECRERNIKEHVLNKVFDTGIAFKVLQKAM